MIPEIKLTSAGAALLAKVHAGEAVPLSRWQFGTGALAPGESIDRTALVTPMDYISLDSVEVTGDRATVLGQFTNVGRPAFVWEELGLWATDSDGGEILFCYGNAFGSGEQIQAGTEQLREFIFGTELVYDSAANVTAVIDQSLVFIPRREKGQPDGVATLGPDGKVPEEQLPEMDYIPTSEKGADGGVATLGDDGKVPEEQLPPMDYDPAGSAETVRKELNVHVQDFENPHRVGAGQIPCPPWDSVLEAVSDLNGQLNASGDPAYKWLKTSFTEGAKSDHTNYILISDDDGGRVSTGFIYGTDFAFDKATGLYSIPTKLGDVTVGTTSSATQSPTELAGHYAVNEYIPDTLYYFPPECTFKFNGKIGRGYFDIRASKVSITPKATKSEEYVYSSDRGAYPDDGAKDGAYYKYISGTTLPIIPRMVTGSYVGTGGDELSLSFETAPKVVFLYCLNTIDSAAQGSFTVLSPSENKLIFNQGSAWKIYDLTWSGDNKQVTIPKKGTYTLFNVSGVKYGYVAFS